MAYRHKLSCRLALLRDLLLLFVPVAVAVTCERPIAAPTNVALHVVQIVVVPATLTLAPTQQSKFAAYGRWSNGDTATVAVTWSASGGAIRPDGVYTADTVLGDFQVVATSAQLKLSGSSLVHISGTRPVASVTVSPITAAVAVGQAVQLAVTPRDAYGNPLTGRTITWGTSNAGVATVSGTGLVSGVAAGSVTITATSEGQSGTAGVTVSTVPVASVIVTPAAVSVIVGQTVQLTATPRDAYGNPLTGRTITWGTSNPGVATVTGTGLVSGVAAGSVTITATSEGQSSTAAVTVSTVPVASVIVTPGTVSVIVGQTVQLTATPRDAYGNPLTGRTITWGTSNLGVATVSGTGLVSGVAAGSVTITATSEGQSGTAGVTVSTVPVASVIVTPATVSVIVGQTVQLTAILKDANGNVLTGRTITWTSNNPGVATVNGTGLVTAVAVGTAVITAACEGKSATAAVTATNVPVASVTVSPVATSIAVGQTVQLTATPRDASGNPLTGRTITWGTSNPGVATVSGVGLVSGVAAGSVTITATSEGQSGTAGVTVTALTGGGTVLFHEDFEDTAFPSRGWYDNTSVTITASQYYTGTHALEAHFLLGASTPTWGGAMRHLFTATPTVYVSYWVKYSDNWIGSGLTYHPHEFTMMSDLDGAYDGPSDNYLTVYIEHNYQNGGIPRMAVQDSKSINTSYGTPPINLISVTENRSTSGCNGVVESNVSPSCYNAPPWYNAKIVDATQVWFQPIPGPGYKGNWNHVEAYYQINSIVNGVGKADGVMQYWFNGTLAIDRHDILFRTGAHPSINFHQFLIAPYIGNGSPVDQYMWVDNLTVATSHP